VLAFDVDLVSPLSDIPVHLWIAAYHNLLVCWRE